MHVSSVAPDAPGHQWGKSQALPFTVVVTEDKYTPVTVAGCRLPVHAVFLPHHTSVPVDTALNYMARSIPYAGLLLAGWRQQGPPPSALAKHWLYRSSLSAQLFHYVLLPVGSAEATVASPRVDTDAAGGASCLLLLVAGLAAAAVAAMIHNKGTCIC